VDASAAFTQIPETNNADEKRVWTQLELILNKYLERETAVLT